MCVCEQDCNLFMFIFPNSVWFIHCAWLLCGLESQINRFAKFRKCFSSIGMIFKFRQLFFGNKCISKDLFFISGIPALHYSMQTRKLFEQWNPDHRKQSMGNFGNAKFTVLRLNLSNTMLSKSALQRASNHIMLLIKFEKYMEAMTITSQWLFSLVWLTALENFQRI